MFKAAKLSQDVSVTKSSFECSVLILSVMHTASNNWKRAVILMLIQNCFLLHGRKCFVTSGRNSHFFVQTHSTKLWRMNTPFTGKFRGSAPHTGQTWRGWKLVLVHQRHANCSLLGALFIQTFLKLCVKSCAPIPSSQIFTLYFKAMNLFWDVCLFCSHCYVITPYTGLLTSFLKSSCSTLFALYSLILV